MMNYSQTHEFDTWEEVFYDYVKCPGWNQVRIGFNGIEYSFSQGDFIQFEDKDGKIYGYFERFVRGKMRITCWG